MSSFRREACVALASCALLFLAACDKKKEAAAPPSGGMPPLDQPTAAAPGAGDHPTHAPSGEGAAVPPGHPVLPPGHPPMVGGTAGGAPSTGAPGENPHGGGEAPSAFGGTTPGGEFDPKTVVEGVIKVDGKLKDKVAAGDVIFVVARKYEEGAT